MNVRARLDYDPDTGVLTWKRTGSKMFNTRFAGTEAGTIATNGYRYIMIGGKLYLAHRLIWRWMTGEWPAAELDHVNMDRLDNRWSNLRAATRGENSCNRKRQTNNTTGCAGVGWDKARNMWSVRIKAGGRYVFRARLEDYEMACLVASEARDKYHGNFANGSN